MLTDRLARIHHFRERLLAELSHDLRAPAADRPHARRAAAPQPPRPRVDAETQGIRLAALDALEQVDAMLEQVRRDHGEARLVARRRRPRAASSARSPSSSTPLAHEREITLVVERPGRAARRASTPSA